MTKTGKNIESIQSIYQHAAHSKLATQLIWMGAFLLMTQIASAQPDLVFQVNPVIDSSTSVLSDGATLTFHYTERNSRNAQAGAHTNRYYLSSDTTIGNDTEIFPAYSSAGLAFRQEDTVNASVSFTISPGTYYLVVRLDADNDVTERNENNNDYIITTTPITVTAPPTPTPTNTFTPTPVPTATNTPTITPTPTDTPTLPPGVTPSPTPIPTDTPTPTNTPVPTATFTPTDTPTPTSTFTPTATATPTPGVQGPDLYLSSGPTITSTLTLPDTGGTIDVTFTENNDGLGNRAQSRADAHTNVFYLSTDQIIGNGDDIALTPTDASPRIDSGNSRTVNVTLTIPGTPGTYYLYLSLDDANVISELYEHNNTMLNTGQIITVLAPTPTPTPVPTDTPVPTATSTPVPTDTPVPTATNTPVPTDTPVPTATNTPVPTDTPVPTATSTPVPTDTPVPTATNTPVPTDTPVPTATSTPVPTDTPVPTATSTPVPTDTPVPTATSTPVPTDTPVPTATSTPVPTDTPVPTATSTPVPTDTPVPTATSTPVPTDTPVPTATSTPEPINTPTPTVTSTPVPTDTPVPTATSTPVPAETPTPEQTPIVNLSILRDGQAVTSTVAEGLLVDNEIQLDLSTDAGSTLSYITGPENAAYLGVGNTGTLSWIPSATQVGDFSAIFRADNGAGTTKDVMITLRSSRPIRQILPKDGNQFLAAGYSNHEPSRSFTQLFDLLTGDIVGRGQIYGDSLFMYPELNQFFVADVNNDAQNEMVSVVISQEAVDKTWISVRDLNTGEIIRPYFRALEHPAYQNPQFNRYIIGDYNNDGKDDLAVAGVATITDEPDRYYLQVFDLDTGLRMHVLRAFFDPAYYDSDPSWHHYLAGDVNASGTDEILCIGVTNTTPHQTFCQRRNAMNHYDFFSFRILNDPLFNLPQLNHFLIGNVDTDPDEELVAIGVTDQVFKKSWVQVWDADTGTMKTSGINVLADAAFSHPEANRFLLADTNGNGKKELIAIGVSSDTQPKIFMQIWDLENKIRIGTSTRLFENPDFQDPTANEYFIMDSNADGKDELIAVGYARVDGSQWVNVWNLETLSLIKTFKVLNDPAFVHPMLNYWSGG
jgi:hypothetical protein